MTSFKTPAWSVGAATMTFQRHAAFFQPHELDALTAAYDSAWQHICDINLGMTATQASLLKKKLVQIILASACTGECDMERLREIALRGVAGTRLVKEPELEHCE